MPVHSLSFPGRSGSLRLTQLQVFAIRSHHFPRPSGSHLLALSMDERSCQQYQIQKGMSAYVASTTIYLYETTRAYGVARRSNVCGHLASQGGAHVACLVIDFCSNPRPTSAWTVNRLCAISRSTDLRKSIGSLVPIANATNSLCRTGAKGDPGRVALRAYGSRPH
jgi:hypothetical protein